MNFTQTIPLADLVIGSVADRSFYDEQGALLVPSGLQITEALIATLRARSIEYLHSSCDRERNASADLGSSTEDAPLVDVYSPQRVQQIRSSFQSGATLVDNLVRQLTSSGQFDLQQAETQVDHFIGELTQDPDAMIANALQYESNLKLATRCIQLSVLAMAIGLRLDLGREQLQLLGAAGLMHDWGLFDLPITARFPHQRMNETQRNRYRQHPQAAKEMLQFASQANPDLKNLVAQVHELLDGSGFPARLPAAQIHPLSRILGVADAYLTMTSPPKDFPRIIPCDAMAYLISAASRGQYSAKAVNGLLRAVTIYPIGSIVELSDQTRARVIRSDHQDYGSPIVESLDHRGKVLRLKDESVFIARPIPSHEMHEVRLPDAYESLGMENRVSA